jgi:hypothetical protein
MPLARAGTPGSLNWLPELFASKLELTNAVWARAGVRTG